MKHIKQSDPMPGVVYRAASKLWIGHLTGPKLTLLYQRMMLGVATKKEHTQWRMQQWRIILLMMKCKQKQPQRTMWRYERGWLYSHDMFNPRHNSFFEFLSSISDDLTYGTNGQKQLANSISHYWHFRQLFWTYKAIWELREAGVGGLDPALGPTKTLGKHLVDYHYWRKIAMAVVGHDQPGVAVMENILRGGHPDYIPSETELKPGRRLRDTEKLHALWVWFDSILTPLLSSTKETRHDD